ncbi:MAG: hypothetical protein JO211_08565, partial [Acidobacteriaceae bacterium]|nr:hypothetical protein [Acidobacteriaceae bacterium]
MKAKPVFLMLAAFSIFAILPASAQSNSDQTTTTTDQKTVHTKNKGRSAGGDIGSGAGDV